MSKLQSKNIIVTGGSSGIGERIAWYIAENGGTPILVARSEDKLIELKQQINETFSVNCQYYVVDLIKLDEWENCLQTIIRDYNKIDAVINNAGFGVFDYIEDTKWDDVERMFKLNVFALIRGVHQTLPHLIKNKKSHIINIASQAGKIATPKSSIYSATKHAVIGFTNALRLEVERKGVYVTAVNLGPVRTNFFNVADPSGGYQKSVDRYMLDPDDVAKKVVGVLFTNKREINMPGWMNVGSKFYQLFPSIVEKMLKKQFNRK
ncbi:SDR family NAD(P)-dependent oxidoreductase [Aquibacillus rhizosphaerae]|uniref:SDR family oxidoreductase n=1 Tax=Aquibacillus rhizosphaerae TaxID=3051431 RepID=A0ABT7L691_9BACI|nr:SDR family oxidoreductase [Aquibacillus sp. LR5S19]MDL4840725.1 SDR family oxidoreductase [Aquibacillus sp. LR5S19]